MSRFQILREPEISAARESGRILRECLAYVAERAVPGITTGELDAMAETFIRDAGGTPAFKGYQGFTGTLCTSINDACVHGIPGAAALRDGDLLSLDCGVVFGGMCTDACVTVLVGSVSEEAQRLSDVTKDALEAACALVRPGLHVGDISATVQEVVESGGFHCMHALTGHGLGTSLHQFPDIPNIGERRTGPVLPVDTLIAIEPITSLTTNRIREGNDGWTILTADGSLSAHWEHTVLVTRDGHEILA